MIDELKWSYLTGVVSDIKSPNQFLKRLLMGNTEELTTETIRIETESNGRDIAPFVRKNGEAIMVPGYGAKGYSVDAPNIRIKRPFTPSDLLYNRSPGQANIFAPTAADVGGAVDRHIRKDLTIMENMVVNAEEYLTSMALQGQITYVQEDEEVFQITFAKPSANNITLSVFLDDATPANIRFLTALELAKQVVADAGMPALTDAICGSEAANALTVLFEIGALKWMYVNAGNGANVGSFEGFQSKFSDDGVQYLGTLAGIRFWRYGRTANLNGVTVNMIRPKYIEFVSTSSASGRVMYYGAIPDVTALRNKTWVGRRFSKSWEQQDPSALMSLVHSRPLPVFRNPAANVSMKVVSG